MVAWWKRNCDNSRLICIISIWPSINLQYITEKQLKIHYPHTTVAFCRIISKSKEPKTLHSSYCVTKVKSLSVYTASHDTSPHVNQFYKNHSLKENLQMGSDLMCPSNFEIMLVLFCYIIYSEVWTTQLVKGHLMWFGRESAQIIFL